MTSSSSSSSELAARVQAGDLRALARAITLIENDAPEGAAIVRALFSHTGHAYLVGMTGPPGAGKSTLVDQLVRHVRAAGQTVGVIAVDPTSPYTGGAILGDRVRMQAHAGDSGVFIRSMATRGHLGGLARATNEVALLLDAAGRDVIIIETVGVGQDEIDIVRTADISIVTLVPGTGDDVQALKAGIMEIADIFIVNKADREGADRTAAAVEAMLNLQTYAADDWRPRVLRTEATTGKGVADVLEAIQRFRAHSAASQGARRRARAEFRLRELLGERFLRHVESRVLDSGELERYAGRIASRELDPYTASDEIMARALQRRGPIVRATLDHIGVAVNDLRSALAFYRDALGLEIGPAEEVPTQGVRATFVPAGEAAIELLEATVESSPIAKFIAKRGPGLHHITLRVEDIGAALALLRARGVRLIDESPRPGAHGSLVAFVHPSAAQGVLVELVQAVGQQQRP